MTLCNDGWVSPSSNIQGTCSHHCGVAPTTPTTSAPSKSGWSEFAFVMTMFIAIHFGMRRAQR